MIAFHSSPTIARSHRASQPWTTNTSLEMWKNPAQFERTASKYFSNALGSSKFAGLDQDWHRSFPQVILLFQAMHVSSYSRFLTVFFGFRFWGTVNEAVWTIWTISVGETTGEALVKSLVGYEKSSFRSVIWAFCRRRLIKHREGWVTQTFGLLGQKTLG